MAKLFMSWRMLANIPTIITWSHESLSRKEVLVILKRANESSYYGKHAKQQVCGCYAIGNYYTSYLMDCDLHGWDAIFPDMKRDAG